MRFTYSGTRFVGRSREFAEVIELVRQRRLVTLSGPGGTGKTRLAIHVLGELEPSFSDGAFFVSFAELTDSSLVGSLVAAELGVPIPGSGFTPQLVVDHIGDRTVLLLLDNCEHLVEAVASLVSAVLRACPAVTVLATSRIPLGLAPELVYEVVPLDVPSPGARTAAEIQEIAAVELYLDRARASGAGFQLSDANAPAVASLVTALGGLPLALEMAGARARSVAPEALVTRLGDQILLLGSRYRDGPQRHQSLVANLSWSYDLCSHDEQALWCRLSVFAGGFDLDAAETVAAAGTIAPTDVLDLVASLVDQSILATDHAVPGRYRMLEPVRQFGLSRLAADHELDVWQPRHLVWVLSLAHDLTVDWLGPDQSGWMRRIRLEHANIRAALEFATSDPSHARAALGLCRDLEVYWMCDGSGTEARHWVDRALAVTDEASDEEVQAAAMAAWLAAAQLDLTYAHALAGRAGRVLHDDCMPRTGTESRDRLDTTRCIIATYDGDLASALRHGQAAMAGFTAAGRQESHEYFLAAFYVSLILLAMGRNDEAEDIVRGAIACSDRYPGDLYYRTSFYYVLGMLALASGDPEAALAHEREALRSAWELRFDTLVTLSLDAIAGVTATMGRAEHSAAIYGAATKEFQRIGFVTLFADLAAGGQAAASMALGAAKFEQAQAAGAAAPLESVVSVALTGQDPTTATDRYAPLTRRETEIAALVADGLGNRAIAERLFLSERTVQGHIQNSLSKLHANSRAAIATWYVRRTPAD
jgi:non-specific serine/threonine protein kinase